MPHEAVDREDTITGNIDEGDNVVHSLRCPIAIERRGEGI